MVKKRSVLRRREFMGFTGAGAIGSTLGHSSERLLASQGQKSTVTTLLKDDAYAIGLNNQDPYDHALGSAIEASSEKSDLFKATNVINGVNRGAGLMSNRWTSNPGEGLPQELKLRLPVPSRISEIHLVFDSGLNRQLTLSHSDSTNQKQIRGPQPETVRDYDLELLHGETSVKVATVNGNYQRKRIHQFQATTADGIRLKVRSTNGSAEASIFEVRAYS